jgi:hypothetical protein
LIFLVKCQNIGAIAAREPCQVFLVFDTLPKHSSLEILTRLASAHCYSR